MKCFSKQVLQSSGSWKIVCNYNKIAQDLCFNALFGSNSTPPPPPPYINPGYAPEKLQKIKMWKCENVKIEILIQIRFWLWMNTIFPMEFQLTNMLQNTTIYIQTSAQYFLSP